MGTGFVWIGRLVRLLGKVIKILGGLCLFCMIASLLGFAYKLIDTMIPGCGYYLMAQQNVFGDAAAWYYLNIYLPNPWFQTVIYYLTNWGGAVLAVLFRVLRQVCVLVSNKLILWGTGLMNRGLSARARNRSEENKALAAELDEQKRQNAELKRELGRRPEPEVKAPREHKLLNKAKEGYRAMRQKELDEAAEQRDAWGRWSRKK